MKSLVLLLASVVIVTCQFPKPDYSVYNISIPNTVYRFRFRLVENVFVDADGNNISSIDFEWLLGDNSEVSKQDFVQLKLPEKVLIGYVSPAVYDNYPKPDGYKYILKGTDRKGNSNTKIYYVKLINDKPPSPSYLQSITLKSDDAKYTGLNDVEILFSIQETKLLAYSQRHQQGIANVFGIITEFLKIDRVGSSLSIRLTWSATQFLRECSIDKINQLRRQIIGENKQRYEASFLSEFQIDSFSEMLQTPCDGLSLKNPVIGSVNWNSISVRFGRYFSLDVPKNIFLNPDGATMDIKIELRDRSLNTLPSTYWVNLVGESLQSTYKIHGYITYNVAFEKLTYNFFIVASTPFEMMARRLIQIDISQFSQIDFKWTVVLSLSTALTSSPINFFQQFVTSMTEFLQASRNSVLIINYTPSKDSFKFEWSVTGDLTANQYTGYTNKLQISEGQPTSEFSSLLTNLGYGISKLEIKTQSSGPVAQYSNFALSISPDTVRFIYNIPKTFFVDEEDGDLGSLKLNWLTLDGRDVPASSWVQLRPQTQSLIGYVSPQVYSQYVKDNNIFTFVLQAEDKDGNSNSMNFTCKILGPLQTPSYYIQTLELKTSTASYSSTNDVEILFRIQENFLIKYNTINAQGINNVNQLTTQSLTVTRNGKETTVLLVWGSTIFFANECPLQNIITYRKAIILENNPKYIGFFQPDFSVSLKEEKLVGACSSFSLKPPQVGPGELNQISLRFGVYFAIAIPNDLFIPPETTSLTSLQIGLTIDGLRSVSSRSWIYISKNSQDNTNLLEACATTTIISTQSTYTFSITAVTPLDMRVSREIRINFLNKPPSQYKWLSLFSFSSVASPLVVFIRNFVSEISTFIGKKQSDILVTDFTDNNPRLSLQWTIQGDLTSTEVNNINNKLSQDGKPTSVITNRMQKIGAQLTSVEVTDESSFKPMPDREEEGFVIDKKLNRFSYKIQENTFVDKQDGGTSKLMLECLQENFQPIPRDNFIQLDLSRMQFIGYLSPIILRNFPSSGYKFILRATDKDNNSNIKTYTVRLSGTDPISPSYQQTLVLSTIVTSYFSLNYVQLLYYIQDILYSYSALNNQGIGSVNDIITLSYIVNRDFGQIHLFLTWSAENFRSIRNCPIANIIRFREAFKGEKKEKFARRFNPNFKLEEMNETLLLTCSSLSLHRPLVGNNHWRTHSISYGKQFTINVPNDLFVLPGGSTSNIAIELFDSNNNKLSDQSWITLSKNILSNSQLLGYVTYSVARRQTSYQFFIVGTTQFLESTNYPVTFTITDFNPIGDSVWAVSFKATRFTGTFAEWVNTFINTLSKFLAVSSNELIVIGFTQRNSVYDLQWGFRNSNQMTCAILKSYRNKLYNGASINSELEKRLNDIGYVATSVEVLNGDECKHIAIRNNLGRIDRYDFFSFSQFFASDAYKDPDNHPLSYAIESENPFSSRNWIGVDSSKRRIYGVPILSNILKGVTYTFNLQVSDSMGESIIDEFYVEFLANLPQRNHLFKIKGLYVPHYTSLAEVLENFLMKLNMFFGNMHKKEILIYHMEVFPNHKRFEIYYFNSTFSVANCDRKNKILVNQKLFHGKTPNPKLIDFMRPKFKIESVHSFRNGTCNDNKIPVVNINELFQGNFPGVLDVVWGQYYMFKLPKELFRDEDNYELNLILANQKTPFVNLPMKYFMSFDRKEFIIYLVPYANTINSASPGKYMTFFLSAFDDMDNGVSIEILVKPQVRTTASMYHVQFYLDVFGIAHEPYAKQLAYIIPQLETILGADYKHKICVKTYELYNIRGNDGNGILSWIPCNVPEKKCDYKLISDLQNLFFVNGIINSRMRIRKENVQISNIVEEGANSCKKTPPQVKRPVPPLTISFCGLFRYQIPEKTFYDAEDGFTRSLKLSLMIPRTRMLPDWVYFDTRNQIIYVLPTTHMYSEYPKIKEGIVLILEAEDRSSLRTSQALTMMFTGVPQKVDVKISVQGFFHNINNNMNPLLLVALKVGEYFADNAKGFEAISSTKLSSGEMLIEFGNCTIPYEPCDLIQQQSYLAKMKSDANTFRPSFRKIFSPEANMVTLGDQFTGPCISTDNPPKVTRVLNNVVVSISSTVVYYIPSDTFTDHEDGSTRNLKLQLLYSDRTILQPSSWISFDSRRQTITFIATREKAKMMLSTKLLLIARDKKDQTAEQTFAVHIEYPIQKPSFYFRMEFMLNPPMSQTHNQIYGYLRDRLKYFFGDYGDSVAYISTSYRNNGLLVAKWTNVTFSRSFCEANKIKNMALRIFVNEQMGTFRTSFQNSLNFHISSLSLHYDGVCKSYDDSPKVLNPIREIQLSHCEYASYQVPENTFHDNTDGNTRNLKLAITRTNGRALPEIFSFRQQSQTLIISPIENMLKGSTSPYIFNLLIKATNSKGRSTTTPLNIKLVGEFGQHNFYFKIYATWWRYDKPYNKAEVSHYIVQKTRQYFDEKHSFRVVSISDIVNNQFEVDVTPCGIRHTFCDIDKINFINSRILDSAGSSYNMQFAFTFYPDFRLYKVSISKIGNCADVEWKPPSQYMPLPQTLLQMCSHFSYRLDPKTFIDHNGNHDLMYVVSRLNGKPIDESTSWIASKSTKFIYATINNKALSDGRSHVVTVRAFDSRQQFVEAPWHITINGARAQKLYQITTEVKINGISEAFVFEKYHFVRAVNEYFRENITNIIDIQPMGNARLKITWSSCNLPLYCDNRAAEGFLQKMKRNGVILSEFQQAFGFRYHVISVEMLKDKSCLHQQNSPPVPSTNHIHLNAFQCDGLVFELPTTLFYDREDGYTPNLKCILRPLSYAHALPPWVYFDETKKIIYAHPSRDEVKELKFSLLQLILTAYDKDGAQASININVDFKLPVNEKFSFAFIYNEDSNYVQRVREVSEFKRKLANFLNQVTNSLSLVSYGGRSDNSKEVVFTQCAKSHLTCQDHVIKRWRESLLTQNNYPNDNFVSFMRANFYIKSVSFTASDDCHDQNSPPILLAELLPLRISPCGVFSYRIPRNCFYDKEDGDTRNLDVDVLNSNANPLSHQHSWLHFDKTTQTLYAIPAVREYKESGHIFILTATDKSSATTKANWKIIIEKLSSEIEVCMIKTKFRINTNANKNTVHHIATIIEKIKVYFKLDDSSDFAIIDFKRHSVNEIELHWTYCFKKVQNKELLHMLVKKVFLSNMKTLQPGFIYSVSPDYTITHAETEFSDECPLNDSSGPHGPQPKYREPIYRYASPCSEFMYYVPNDLFTHPVQGDIRNMHLRLRKGDHGTVGKDEWIQINKENSNFIYIQGQLTDDVIKHAQNSRYHYKIVCTDSNGNEAHITFVISILSTNSKVSKPEVVLLFEEAPSTDLTTPIFIRRFVNELSSYLNPNGYGQQVYVNSYSKHCYVHFSFCSSMCDHSKLQNIMKKLGELKQEKSSKHHLQHSNILNEIRIKSVVAGSPECRNSIVKK